MISRRSVLKWLASFVAASAATGGYAVAGEPMLWPRVTRYDIRPKRWPAGLTLKIAALADIHACEPWMSAERIRDIVERTNALGADLIVLLGDYAAAHRFVSGRVPAADWARELGRLHAPLGVHAILGNHDWWDDFTVQRTRRGEPYGRRALEDAGIRVYQNEAARIEKGSSSFWLAGLGDQLAFQVSRRLWPGQRFGVDDLPATLSKISDDAPVVLLAHEPDIMPDVPDRVSLVLSGHTHGGQVRLFGWSPIVPSDYGNRYAYGHVREQCDLVISGGLGCSIAPVRFGVRPEVVLLTVGADSLSS